MKSSRVKEAAVYLDRLERLRSFREFYLADPKGIRIAVDGLYLEVSRVVNREVSALLDTEERMILNTLGLFGVELEPEAPAKEKRA